MKIIVKFFGLVAEAAGSSSAELTDVADSNSLIKKLNNDYPKLNNCQYSFAVNKIIATENINLKDGDEVALLPPFAGG